ncbi:SHOCT domain-containing protein [Actinocatenispora sera]|uniref:SHOCT domain-containing protein n=1 Tax=Actinocatenispora sera TaxID=390989 RepID=UPI003406C1F5
MFMRPGLRRGPGLLGAVARTAVVAGTATAVSRGVNRSLDNRAQGRAEAAAYEQAAAQQQQPAQQQPPAQQGDLMAQLQRLADLRQQGLLDDQEFAAAKAKLLAS